MSLSRGVPLVLAAAGLLSLGCGGGDVTSPSKLESPSHLTTQELPSGNIQVSWQDNSDNESAFELSRSSTGSSGTYQVLATLDSNVSTYQDTTVAGSTQYCYRVRALGPSGTDPSAFSSPSCIQPAPPTAPSQLAASATFSQIDLSWTDNSDNEAGFEIWKSSNGQNGTFALEASVAADVAAYSSTDLQDGSEYCYRVRSIGPKDLASEFSNTTCATTPVPTSPPPAAPTDLVATAKSPSSVSLAWTDHASNEQGFEVWRSTDGIGGAYALLQSVGANSSSADDTGLTGSAAYCYKVRAVGGSGVPPSDFTQPSCATTPPEAPSDLTSTATSSTSISLVWTDHATAEQGFQLWRSTTGANGSYSVLLSVGADITAADDNSLTPGTQYCYKVLATGAGPASDFSNSSCATTPLAPPAAPSNLALAVQSGLSIDLTWQDNATDEAGFEVWRSTTGASGTYTKRTNRPANSESYSDTGLSSGTEYCYKVLAAGAGGAPDSPFSNADCATTSAASVIRITLFGDSNTDRCEEDTSLPGSYVSIAPRQGPNAAHLSCMVAGKVQATWHSQRTETIKVVNHGIGGTTTGGLGGTGDPTRSANGAPNARLAVNGITRFEAEVLGTGAPNWNGGEPNNGKFPGPITRVNAYVPDDKDFAYVSLGTNDDAGATRTLTAAQTETNLRWMVQKWIDAGHQASHFILTTLPPRVDANSPTSIPDRNTRIRDIANDTGVHLIDLSNHLSDDNGATWRNPSDNIGDGVHYTATVRQWIADQVVDYMSSVTPP